MLEKDVKLKMKEGEVKTITIADIDEDIDDDTVMRFLEYAYTGDYASPSPDVLQLLSDTEVVAEAFVSNQDEGDLGEAATAASVTSDQHVAFEPEEPPRVKSKKGKKKKVINFWHEPATEGTPVEPVFEYEPEFRDERETHICKETDPFQVNGGSKSTRRELWENFCSQAHTVLRESWLPSVNNDQREDFTEVFLCHARLYKFSDRYECDGLMTLALQKLRLTLSRYTFYQERASSVVELLRYTYKHTMEYKQGQDKLRVLVLEYNACYIKQLMREQTFLELLEEGGKFAGDIATKIMDLID